MDDVRRSWPYRLALFAFGSLSILSLLLYFVGVAAFRTLAISMLAVQALGLGALAASGRRYPGGEGRRLASGLWAGCLATVAYDLVRVPIVHAGIPVFKAISYFGTVLLGVDHPTMTSEVAGWAYHLSNGVSFALMYAALIQTPGPVSAVAWGLSLEGAMLLTPYAEVFGYQRDARFFAITIGSHAVYGLVLWLALRTPAASAGRVSWRRVVSGGTVAVLGLAAMGADFNRRYGAAIPSSPPPYIGPHLYTVWNVPEPDRVAAMWVMSRFVDRDATFNFIEPFQSIRFGTAFDIPEAAVRRTATLSATQVLLSQQGLTSAKLDVLARTTELTEIAPWRLASDIEASQLAQRMRGTTEAACGRVMTTACLPVLLADLDSWYGAGPQ